MATHAVLPLTPDLPTTFAAEDLVVDAYDLTRAFDGRGVLSGVDLRIHRGEVVALLGRSGSGKSTLLRILARLDNGYDGQLAHAGRVAVAFQDSRLLPWKRVLANVVLGGSGPDVRERARHLLDEVGLAGFENAWPVTLSGGEAQRAALARALVPEPDLLLMDEPFGALDALTRIRMHRLVRTLIDRHRPATLLVTHDVDEAILLADRVLVLTDGVLSHDVRVDLPPTGRRHHADFPLLRTSLLDALGVVDDDTDTTA